MYFQCQFCKQILFDKTSEKSLSTSVAFKFILTCKWVSENGGTFGNRYILSVKYYINENRGNKLVYLWMKKIGMY